MWLVLMWWIIDSIKSKDLSAWWTRCSCDWSRPWKRRSRSLLAMQLGVLLFLPPPPFPLASSSSPTPGSSCPFRYCFLTLFSRENVENGETRSVWELEWENCRRFNLQQIFRNKGRWWLINWVTLGKPISLPPLIYSLIRGITTSMPHSQNK